MIDVTTSQPQSAFLEMLEVEEAALRNNGANPWYYFLAYPHNKRKLAINILKEWQDDRNAESQKMYGKNCHKLFKVMENKQFSKNNWWVLVGICSLEIPEADYKAMPRYVAKKQEQSVTS